jgi:hypothetical protein
MRQTLAALGLLGAGALALTVPAAAREGAITGTWEAARTVNDERLYVVLGDNGKAEVVEEYLLPTPGKQRARSSTFGKWKQKGPDVVITYGSVTDRLRYMAREPLAAVGLSGSAPALKPVGKPDDRSKIGSEVLWKGQHEYHMKPDANAQAPVPAAEAGGGPAKR